LEAYGGRLPETDRRGRDAGVPADAARPVDWISVAAELNQAAAMRGRADPADPAIPLDPSELALTRADLEDACEIAQLGVWRWIVGSQDFSWSSEVFRIAGRSPADFVPTLDRTFDCLHADDRAAMRQHLYGTARTGLPVGREFRIVRPDGGIRHCWAKIRPILHDRTVVAVRGVLLDITERKEAEGALQASQQHYRNAVALSPQIPWMSDAEGNILEVGPRWPELVGTSCEEALGQGWIGSLHPDDVAPTLTAWAHSLRTGEHVDLRYRLRQRDGRHTWFRVRADACRNDRGEIVRWYGLVEDIHEQVAAELALREGEYRLRSAHQAAGIGEFEIDFIGGAAHLSEQSLLLHGLTADADPVLPGKDSWSVLVHPEDGPRAWAAVDEAVRTGALYDFTFRVPLPDGDMRWVNGLGRVHYDEAGQPVRMLGINIDVTARKQAELSLEGSEAFNRSIVEASTDSIKLLGADGRILFENEASRRAMELDGNACFIGRDWLSLWPETAQVEATEALRTALAGGSARFSAARATAKGTIKWWDVVVSPVLAGGSAPIRLLSIARDITHQKHTEDQVQWSATHDALTLLPNRRLFETRLAEAVEEALVSGEAVGLIAVDLDRLKQINDTLGHDAGNAILQTIGQRLQESIRPGDTAARLGGDEFAIILRGVEGEAELAAIGQRALARLREPFVYAGQTLDCRSSMGASLYPHDTAEPTELLKYADMALYSSKTAGRGGLLLFRPQMRADLQQRVSMIAIARDAIAANRVAPHYQPKIDLVSGRIAGFEALMRWTDRTGCLRLPGALAAAFEDHEVATSITDRMLDRSLADISAWIAAGVDFGHVAINASAADFRRPDFAEQVIEALRRAQVPAERLQIEITEPVILGRSADSVGKALRRLADAGVRIALDDFGTGYASLSHLKQFPVDVIKIDGSFLADARDDGDAAPIVEAVVNLGRSLDLDVVAEGVETVSQARRLQRLGCRYGQGFLFSAAVAAADVPAICRRSFDQP
jgi:diguanylate cyclase (GGDEF)-like protein/PAS domain S-box-containing protein